MLERQNAGVPLINSPLINLVARFAIRSLGTTALRA
jgi:hypothetical protein